MRNFLRRVLGVASPSTEPRRCNGCATKDEEIRWLRMQHDTLLDRLMVSNGVLDATREALRAAEASTADPDQEIDPGELEAEEETVGQRAASEIRQFAEANGIPIEATYDGV